MVARTYEQLSAWAELLELCEDECEVFRTTKAMRTVVVEVERELARLHKIEDLALQLKLLINGLDRDCGYEVFPKLAEICRKVEGLIQ